MKIARLDQDLVVRLSDDIVDALDLKEGDEVAVFKIDEHKPSAYQEQEINEALEAIRKLRKPLPPGWRFDREEANAR